MEALARAGLVRAQDVYTSRLLWGFGRLINNTDMHLGNLSLSVDATGFRLLPVYDMCSMGFAPRSGEVLPYAFSVPDLGDKGGLSPQMVATVTRMVEGYWRSLIGDARLSSEFREFLRRGNLG